MPRSSRRAVTLLMVLGLFLLQAAWVLVMPPFGAVDEFDHAYRASAAAHGEIFTDLGRPDDGRGLLVTVNDGIAAAARPQCEVLDYPGPDNCVPVDRVGDDMVTIASAAAVYQPTYYVAVGWVTHLVDGFAGLYAMRLVSALLCTALFGFAVWIISGWARSAWPLVACVVTLTPTTLYSLSVLAPNGVEMMLGLALWACLIGITRSRDPDFRARLVLTAIPLASTFAWIRPFSPIWLFFMLVVWLFLLGLDGIRELVSKHRVLIGVAVIAVGVSAATSAGWVLTHTSGEPAGTFDIEGTRWGQTLRQIPLWFLQVIAGVPFRNTPATLDVYLAGVVVFGFALLPLLRCRTPRVRLAALLTVVAALAPAVWYTYSRLPSAGPLWQGRYGWCLALGVALLAGVAWEDGRHRMIRTVGLVFGIPFLVLMQLRSLQFVLEFELGESPLRGGAWVSVPLPALLVVATAGIGAWLLAGRVAATAARTPSADPRGDAAVDAPVAPSSGREG